MERGRKTNGLEATLGYKEDFIPTSLPRGGGGRKIASLIEGVARESCCPRGIRMKEIVLTY